MVIVRWPYLLGRQANQYLPSSDLNLTTPRQFAILLGMHLVIAAYQIVSGCYLLYSFQIFLLTCFTIDIHERKLDIILLSPLPVNRQPVIPPALAAASSNSLSLISVSPLQVLECQVQYSQPFLQALAHSLSRSLACIATDSRNDRQLQQR